MNKSAAAVLSGFLLFLGVGQTAHYLEMRNPHAGGEVSRYQKLKDLRNKILDFGEFKDNPEYASLGYTRGLESEITETNSKLTDEIKRIEGSDEFKEFKAYNEWARKLEYWSYPPLALSVVGAICIYSTKKPKP